MATLVTTLGAKLATLSLGKVLAIGGTVLSGAGQIQAAKSQQKAAEFQAQQLEAQGKAERAAASLKAEEERRQKELVLSRARAVGAASGGGQDYDLMGELEEDGLLRELTALWEGEERGKGRAAQAAAARFEGKSAKKAGIFRAATGLLSEGSTLYEKYSAPLYEKYG